MRYFCALGLKPPQEESTIGIKKGIALIALSNNGDSGASAPVALT